AEELPRPHRPRSALGGNEVHLLISDCRPQCPPVHLARRAFFVDPVRWRAMPLQKGRCPS
ncbi:hypothetical protein RZS08_00510, partial [Arthrospira platensis SPKY1]|nr:hypothetical protein [Arthrospira platensis SPKY1]